MYLVHSTELSQSALQSAKLVPVIGHAAPATHDPVIVVLDTHDHSHVSDDDDEA